MGRLFWKFFALLWLAQVVTTLLVGAAIWIEHQHFNEHGHFTFESPPPPPPFLRHEHFGEHPPIDFGDRPRPPPPPPGPEILHIPLLPILTGGFVSLFFAALLAWYFSRPIKHLRTAIKGFSKGALETRVSREIKLNDELSDLGKDFDLMASQIEGLVESKQQLLHDVSHELRSPLARIQVATDLVQQQPQRTDEFIGRVSRDVQLMNKLVGELLTLARIDSAMNVEFNEKIDLDELLASIADDAQLESEPRNISIDFKPSTGSFVQGSTQLLSRAFENVIRNAIRHTPNGSIVTIASSVMNDFAVVSITDQGDGVKGISTSSIFEPFTRAPESEAGMALVWRSPNESLRLTKVGSRPPTKLMRASLYLSHCPQFENLS
jgi:two-component system, OmpR family, sensor kinase